jgi:selenide,water dikinase
VGPSTTSAQLLLAGGGHTHALVLRRWAMQPHRRPRARITLVSRQGSALYSGMVPGLVAGIYPRSACTINLRELCQHAGVSFVQAEIGGLDPERHLLLLEGRPALPYDWLSLNLGAVTIPSDATFAGGADAGGTSSSSATAGVTSDSGPVAGGPVAVKPLEPFLAWCAGLSAAIDSAENNSAAIDSAAIDCAENNSSANNAADRRRVWIQGGGAAAIELAFALRARGLAPELGLRGEGLRLGSRAANRLAEHWLTNAGIGIHRGQQPPGPAELPTLACTGSWGPGWLAAAGLPLDGRSRLLTEASLQVQGQPRIFASGDCGVIASQPRPASGVWAVRAAPVLAENLERLVAGGNRNSSGSSSSSSSNSSGSGNSGNQKLKQWRPQVWALQLLADGGVAGAPRALASWGPLTLGPSRWLWHWKDRIDRRFMALFEPPAAMAGGAAMACRGCAAKLAAAPLAAALERLAQTKPEQNQPAAQPSPIPRDDAAVISQTANGELLLQSVDGFPALVDDPWLNGRLTTLHACSDLWACGARVDSVLALVTLPAAAPQLQVDLLHQTLAGVQSVLEPLQARLLGGHTMEARDGIKPEAGLAVSLSANGLVAPERHWPKGPLAPGDVLILSRGLGSGVLFAAAMAGAARPEWLDDALALMQQSQAPVVEILAAHGCRACTDITGFGLLGHLGEMLASAAAPKALRVELIAEAIPSLPGAIELLQTGYASSLAPANAAALGLLEEQIMLVAASAAQQSAASHSKAHPSKAHQSAANKTALLGLLIDPQTCGPLLAALPAERGEAAVAALRAAGFGQAAVVARVLAGQITGDQ